jgi:hypothetical protein
VKLAALPTVDLRLTCEEPWCFRKSTVFGAMPSLRRTRAALRNGVFDVQIRRSFQ